MRVALVHSFYRSAQPSGENTVVALEADALRRRGHEVLVVGRSSDDIEPGPMGTARAGWEVATGGGLDPTPQLRHFAPDVTHVHNLFPNFATGWLANWGGPVLGTMHNYRSVCANAVLFRDGRTCTLCPDGHRWSGVRYRCYRDSALATLPIAWRNRRGLSHDPLFRRADRIIVLSQRAHDLFVRAGAPRDRLRVLPNGIDVPRPAPAARSDRHVVVGRLSPEKGIGELLRWWPAGMGLDVVGAGPLRAELEAAAPAGVRFLGAVPRDRLLGALPEYRALVFPGVIPEGAYPLVVVEGWASGVPVVARAGGAAADMVARWGGGVGYDDPDSLTAALGPGLPESDPRALYEREFTVDRWLARLEEVFTEVAHGRDS